MRIPVFLALCLLAACSDFPELEQAQTPGVQTAPYPRLVPLETLLEGPEPRASENDIAELDARAAGLRSRASRIGAPSGQSASDRVAALRSRAEALRQIQ